MGKFDDAVSGFTGEDGTVTLPEDVLDILIGAHGEDVETATADGNAAATADISAIITQAVEAAVAGIKAEAFDALLELPVPDDTDSGANGSENDETPESDPDIDDLFRS